MKDYQNAKIYKICGNGKTYIGSTTQPYISSRFACHKYHYKMAMEGKTDKYLSSYEVLSDPNCYIEIIEVGSFDNQKALIDREGHYIREMECVNRNIAGRNLKDYYLDNKERFHQKYIENKDYKRQYYHDNRDKILKYQKERYKKLKHINQSLEIIKFNKIFTLNI